jgi:hypothetical protein
MKLLSKVLGILLFLMLAAAATAQKNKPWTEWKLKETEKILNDSPWAQTQTITNINEMNYSPANRGGGMGALNQPVNTNFRIRFLSAKPIRQALLRNLVLSRAAEAQVSTAREFVDQTFDDAIVVAVAWDSNDPRYSQLVFTYFSSATTSTLRNETYLEIQGGKRNFLREYQAPTQAAIVQPPSNSHQYAFRLDLTSA